LLWTLLADDVDGVLLLDENDVKVVLRLYTGGVVIEETLTGTGYCGRGRLVEWSVKRVAETSCGRELKKKLKFFFLKV
jgi:hypothetical protein